MLKIFENKRKKEEEEELRKQKEEEEELRKQKEEEERIARLCTCNKENYNEQDDDWDDDEDDWCPIHDDHDDDDYGEGIGPPGTWSYRQYYHEMGYTHERISQSISMGLHPIDWCNPGDD